MAEILREHSDSLAFFELFEVFKLPICRELMDADLQEEIANDTLRYKWLYTDQKEAFEKALQATQSYRRILFHKKMLHAELFHENKKIDLNELLKGSLLHFVVLNPESDALAQFIRSLDKEEIDKSNVEGWTPLMLASQLGKNEYVKCLLAAGADLEREVAGFSSLVLAVKAGQWKTTKHLLEAGACIKQDNNNKLIGGLKETFPAIYFACRQYDKRILNLLLEKEKRLTLMDKKDALLTALEVENLEAVRVLFKHMTKEDKDQFSKKYKPLLLEKAVSSGNLRLVDEMLASDFGLAFNKTDRKILFFALSEKGFLPLNTEVTLCKREPCFNSAQ
ncbi:ankyrin repeat domain-containing protein [Rickettsiella endosymbiont of Dermanyssus gallinae]|uniref:ankyrin repeat domain-containing protein n=1 Tax=Rickettsiella endosymbiont of Dermanyssus gallinae TaxID=2856608 RepID=UPI001C531929|nr:ankyrin repeat domain-containing protein [Rickettsiella endosymbiont of Dermanyssus gallinae]